ncbi:hypothetical protein KCU92_g326, partial [Aureobasidium melanogenum]
MPLAQAASASSSFIDRGTNSQQAMVSQDHAFALWSQSISKLDTFLLIKHNTAKLLRSGKRAPRLSIRRMCVARSNNVRPSLMHSRMNQETRRISRPRHIATNGLALIIHQNHGLSRSLCGRRRGRRLPCVAACRDDALADGFEGSLFFLFNFEAGVGSGAETAEGAIVASVGWMCPWNDWKKEKRQKLHARKCTKCVFHPQLNKLLPSFPQRVLNVGEGNAVKNAVTHGIFVPVGIVLVQASVEPEQGVPTNLEVAAEVPELELEGVKSGEGSIGQSKSEYSVIGVIVVPHVRRCRSLLSILLVHSRLLGDAETGSSSRAGLFCPCGVRAAVGGVPGLINAEGVPALMALAGVCPSTLSASFLIVSSSFSKPVTWNSQYSSAHLNFFSGPRGGSTLGCICFLLSSGLCILMLGLGMLPGVVPAFAGGVVAYRVKRRRYGRSAVAASGAWEGFAWSAFCACSGEEVDFNLSRALSRQIWRTILSLTKVMAVGSILSSFTIMSRQPRNFVMTSLKLVLALCCCTLSCETCAGSRCSGAICLILSGCMFLSCSGSSCIVGFWFFCCALLGAGLWGDCVLLRQLGHHCSRLSTHLRLLLQLCLSHRIHHGGILLLHLLVLPLHKILSKLLMRPALSCRDPRFESLQLLLCDWRHGHVAHIGEPLLHLLMVWTSGHTHGHLLLRALRDSDRSSSFAALVVLDSTAVWHSLEFGSQLRRELHTRGDLALLRRLSGIEATGLSSEHLLLGLLLSSATSLSLSLGLLLHLSVAHLSLSLLLSLSHHVLDLLLVVLHSRRHVHLAHVGHVGGCRIHAHVVIASWHDELTLVGHLHGIGLLASERREVYGSTTLLRPPRSIKLLHCELLEMFGKRVNSLTLIVFPLLWSYHATCKLAGFVPFVVAVVVAAAVMAVVVEAAACAVACSSDPSSAAPWAFVEPSRLDVSDWAAFAFPWPVAVVAVLSCALVEVSMWD